MDPKLIFWTVSLANLGVVVACGARGVAAIRRGDVRRHRRLMATATALVGLFLVSYAAKVVWLGKEDRSAWTPLDYAVLYVHETCIAVMLVAGAVALFRAWRFRRRLGPGPSLPAGPEPLPGGAQHRRAGRVASWAGWGALLTAVGVWAGMVLRSLPGSP